jgi:hypothetical protein
MHTPTKFTFESSPCMADAGATPEGAVCPSSRNWDSIALAYLFCGRGEGGYGMCPIGGRCQFGETSVDSGGQAFIQYRKATVFWEGCGAWA